jgi:hypothetical protein
MASVIPAVIKFAFIEFNVDDVKDKWSAKCKLCRTVLLEKKGNDVGIYEVSYCEI